MARSRMIKPEFWDDETLSKISRDARLVFIALWNFSDDYGVVKGNESWLKNHIFPYDDSMSHHGVFKQWLFELEKGRWILPFDHDGQKFYFIRQFQKHQTINRPSLQRNPAPPETLIEDSLNTHGVLIDEVKLIEVKEKDKVRIKKPKKINGEMFEKFWKAYPKKVAKQDAEKAFLKTNPDESILEIMLNCIESSKKSQGWTKDDGEFIPHPATWLNKRRWEDEIKPQDIPFDYKKDQPSLEDLIN